jgi:hypothetical protein|tara:strand:- start:534 stop:851 length:318 start_codon:yes stop_codon:yes gene_type:complete
MAKFKRKGCGPRGLGTAFKMVTEPKKALKNKKLQTLDPRVSKPDALDTIAQAHYNDDPRTSLADIAKESIKRHGNFGFNLDSEEYKNVSGNYNVRKKRQQYGLDR